MGGASAQYARTPSAAVAFDCARDHPEPFHVRYFYVSTRLVRRPGALAGARGGGGGALRHGPSLGVRRRPHEKRFLLDAEGAAFVAGALQSHAMGVRSSVWLPAARQLLEHGPAPDERRPVQLLVYGTGPARADGVDFWARAVSTCFARFSETVPS